MQITGKIVAIGDIIEGNGARGPWKKQTIVIETQEQYPKKIACLLFNDMTSVDGYILGSTVKCCIDIESREFNGRWYTDVKAWKIEGYAEHLGQQEEEY